MIDPQRKRPRTTQGAQKALALAMSVMLATQPLSPALAEVLSTSDEAQAVEAVEEDTTEEDLTGEKVAIEQDAIAEDSSEAQIAVEEDSTSDATGTQETSEETSAVEEAQEESTEEADETEDATSEDATADDDSVIAHDVTLEEQASSPGGGTTNVSWSGATTITGAASTSNKTYSSTQANQNALLISTSKAVTLTNPTVTKSGGTSAGDAQSFYGTNSAVMCKGGGTTTITGAKVTTNAAGANGIFSYGGNASTNATSGDGTTVVVKNSTITTTGNGSGGIMTTGQGIMKATNLTVSTSGASSAAIRSDRGGRTVTVSGGTYKTSGVGSPAIYSTADITVTGATLTSTASQGAVNEGGNTIILNDCTLNAGNKTLNSQDYFRNGVFLYQSMSGDASEGASVFTMTGGTLNNSYGHVFHVTNTSAAITLSGVSINNTDSEGVFLSVCDDAWSGLSNSATVNATNQAIDGTMLVGSDSKLTLNLKGSSVWTGKTSGSITSHRSSSTVSSSLGTVNVTMSGQATWVLTGDCTVSSLSGVGYINYNGHKLTVGSKTYSSGNIGNVVEKASVTKVAIPTAKTNLTYTGSTQAGVATSSYYTLSGTYKAAKAGTYTAKATLANSSYKWSDGTKTAKTITWSIAQRSIASSKVSVSSVGKQAWTGSAIKPTPTVTFNGNTLTRGASYTLSYKNNTNVGTATITITGKGNFRGTRTVTFKIAKVLVSYGVHVQTTGDQATRYDGTMAGTTGKSKRLEAIWLSLGSLAGSGGISYKTHVQTYGWQDWKSNGALAGTTGESKRLEAIQIKLTGTAAKNYDVYYRVHAQQIGWMGWAKNGAKAGTAGRSLRLEAIQVVLVPKGESAPGTTYKGVTQTTSTVFSSK